MFCLIEYDSGIKELNNFLNSLCADAALRRNLLRIGVVIELRFFAYHPCSFFCFIILQPNWICSYRYCVSTQDAIHHFYDFVSRRFQLLHEISKTFCVFIYSNEEQHSYVMAIYKGC